MPRCGRRRTIRSNVSTRSSTPCSAPPYGRPALLGLLRELSRLPEERAARLRRHLQPLVDRAISYSRRGDGGRTTVRRGDPRLVAVLAAATVTGIATDPEALRAVGWTPDIVALRHLRDELRAFLRAALTP